jgi:hypothetical protein
MELPPAGRKWIGYLLFEILNNRSLQSNFLFENNWKQGWNEIYEVLTDKQSSLSLCILYIHPRGCVNSPLGMLPPTRYRWSHS